MSSNEEKKTTLPKKSLSTVKPKPVAITKKPVAITKKPVAITKQELISKIPKSIRKQERRLRLGIGLPRINESQSTTVERINPMQILLKKTRTKTHPPKFTSKSTDFTEVIGEEAVKKAKKAINSGVPIAQPRWVKNKKKEKELRNFSPFAAYQVAPGRSRNRTKRNRGGKRKRHKTRKRKRKRKRRKHFKGGFFEKPGMGIKAGQTVRIKTKNSTDDTKTWDPCWKVMVMMNRAAIVEKNMEERTVRFTDIKPQGEVSKFRLKCGGKRRKTRRRKKHKRRRKRKTYKK